MIWVVCDRTVWSRDKWLYRYCDFFWIEIPSLSLSICFPHLLVEDVKNLTDVVSYIFPCNPESRKKIYHAKPVSLMTCPNDPFIVITLFHDLQGFSCRELFQWKRITRDDKV